MFHFEGSPRREELIKKTFLGRIGLGRLYEFYLKCKVRIYGLDSLTFSQCYILTGMLPGPPPPPMIPRKLLKKIRIKK